jgi:hypothetical protein
MHIDKWKVHEGDYVDEDNCHWEDAESFLAGKIMGFCGCGNNEVALKYIRDVMELIEKIHTGEGESWRAAYTALDDFFSNNSGLQYTIYYLLDMKELTTHGGSVPGWLTKKGKEVLSDLQEIFPEDR